MTRWLHYGKAALYAGITAALVSLIVETPIVWLFTDLSLWTSARMAAAMVLGPDALAPPTAFDLGIVALAFLIHLALSMLYGLVLALILAPLMPDLRPLTAAGAGVVFGLALYVINLHGIAPLLFPWFVPLQNAITVFSHIVFGAVLGGAYAHLVRR